MRNTNKEGNSNDENGKIVKKGNRDGVKWKTKGEDTENEGTLGNS